MASRDDGRAPGPAGTPGRGVVAEPLTAAAFAPFGEVLSADFGEGREINFGTARRLDFAARLESDRPAARPNLAVFRAAPQRLPFELRLLERHPHSSQTFVPMRGAGVLVCVAPARPDGTPDPGGLRAFVAGPGQGFSLRRGVWHHPVLALEAPAELVVLGWEDGGPGDCAEAPLRAPVVVLPPRG